MIVKRCWWIMSGVCVAPHVPAEAFDDVFVVCEDEELAVEGIVEEGAQVGHHGLHLDVVHKYDVRR